ncbi:MAG: hypothetical protein RMJ19_04880, partial [Gemmatales bacterium]|nr:hypothetical protein [Gemmatales bacterium]MDW8174985.1 hypothetical protein [Gemmatales bacterium]
IGGATLTNSPRNRPENVRRLIHIRANDWVFRGWAIEGADNVKCEDVWHFGTPTHAETRRRLAEALAEVAGRVPVPQPKSTVWPATPSETVGTHPANQPHDVPHTHPTSLGLAPAPPLRNTAVSPVPTAADPASWDFLRATRQLRPVPAADYSGLPYQPLPRK